MRAARGLAAAPIAPPIFFPCSLSRAAPTCCMTDSMELMPSHIRGRIPDRHECGGKEQRLVFPALMPVVSARTPFRCGAYPRSVVIRLRLWWFAALDALSIPPTLISPLRFAGLRGPISLLRLPSRPFPRRLPAFRAAVTLVRLPRMKGLVASFQQTTPCTRPASWSLSPIRLIFAMAC